MCYIASVGQEKGIDSAQKSSNLMTTKLVESDKSTVFGNINEMFFSLKGDIYLLDPKFTSLSQLSKYKPSGSIYTKRINVFTSAFTAGFPGITNRFEWFALEYNGIFYIADSSYYFFSLMSDDGSMLHIDDELIIDNDGLHQPMQIIKRTILNKGFHKIKLQYFQGPRDLIALQLQISKNSINYVPFDVQALNPLMIEENEKEVEIRMRDGIVFDYNSKAVKNNTKIILKEIKKYYLDRLNFKQLIVEGHTDDIGTTDYNKTLSQKRAAAVANYFISIGMSQEKIKTIGYGKEKAIVANNNEANRAKNRRVELRIIKK
ncbi:MAG: OmpA family protein [Cytophagales bacterium]